MLQCNCVHEMGVGMVVSVFAMGMKGLQELFLIPNVQQWAEKREFSHSFWVMLLQLHIPNCADFHFIDVLIYS